MNVPVTAPSKTEQFAQILSNSMVETQSVASFVSVYGNASQDTPPTSAEAEVTGNCKNAEKTDLSSSEAQKSKSETLNFDRLSTGLNCSKNSRKRQQSSISRLKQQQQKLDLENKRIKINWRNTRNKMRKSSDNCKRK